MSDYYDRAGSPITMKQWAGSRERDRRIALTDAGGYWVSTVWLGLDHSFGDGPPLIFETMIFAGSEREVADWAEEYCERYATEAAALAGHDRAVAWAREHAKVTS